MRDNPARGLVAARPTRAEPWDFGHAYDANVFDYIGQLGIPLRPTRDFPDDAEGFFLSLHTRSFPDFAAKIASLRDSNVPVLVTDGLAVTLDRAFLAQPNVYVIEASVSHPGLLDFQGVPDPYDAEDRLRPIRREQAWQALAEEVAWDLSMKYLGDVQMAARVLGIALHRAELDPAFAEPPRSLPHANQPRDRRSVARRLPDPRDQGVTVLPLAELRAALLAPFGVTMRGPTRVSVHPFGDAYLVLHNFNPFPVTVWLDHLLQAGRAIP